MEPDFLKQSLDANIEDAFADANAPLSYLDWKQKRPQLIEKHASYLYGQYVIEWFNRHKNTTGGKTFLLRQKYLYLLDQLQIFFTEKEKTEWYNKINLSDTKELLLAIPFFAKKLKNISLYYLKLRKKLKTTKLKYNTIGTPQGLKQDVYNYLLSVDSDEGDSLFKNYLPSLSALKTSLVVDIEELYDNKDYFDNSPSNSTKYNLFHDITEKYFNTKGVSLSSDEWLFNSLSLTPSENVESFVESLTSVVLEIPDTNLYKNFIEKYLSEDKFATLYSPASGNVEIRSNTIQQGSNVFYYPYSVTDPTITLKENTPTVFLSALSIKGATGGTSLEDSDTIFVKVGNTTKAAWLNYEQYDFRTIELQAQIKQNSTTKFLFPYPGYGLSSEDFAWSGVDTSTTIEYNFLSNELKSSIDNAYWNEQLNTNNCEPIFINNTTLAQNGATVSLNPKFSDQIFIQSRNEKELNLPLIEKDGAWLYKFNQAVIPVTPNLDSKILWPYQIVDEEEYPQYLKNYNFNDVCNNIPVEDLIIPYAIASNKFENADKIYKFSGFNDDAIAATECCWLSGNQVTELGQKLIEQTGFTAMFDSGEVVRFLWTGPNTSLNDVFKTLSHSSDCPFVTNIPKVTTTEWNKCTCKQTYYTPFGHPGDNFNKNDGLADFIALDLSNGISDFDYSTWIDLSGNELTKSFNFAWYKTDDVIGWGSGSWVNGQDVALPPMILERGKRYFYSRAKNKSGELLSPYSVNYNYEGNTNAKRKWISSKLNEDGEWVSTDQASNFNLRSGDLIKYVRSEKTTSQLVSSELVENLGENKGSIWSSLDYLVSGTFFDTTYISWPAQDQQISSSAQNPPFSLTELENLYWWEIQHTLFPTLSVRIESPIENIYSEPLSNTSTTTVGGGAGVSVTVTAPPQLISSTRRNKTIFSFTPPATGTYSIRVSASKIGGTPILFTGIPHLTVVPQYRSEEKLIDFGHKSSGFLIEQPLYGWNYNLNSFDQQSEGAKPYWASLYFEKDPNTKFKGVQNWGYPSTYIEGYLPNHNPKISPLELYYGSVVVYNRNGYSFEWTQPISYQSFNGESRWYKLEIDANSSSNLANIFDSKNRNDLTVVPTKIPSDIILSNIVDGFPVEITYYAQNSFVWNVSVETSLTDNLTSDPTILYTAQTPWSNLGNRFYATVATIPVLEELFSEADSGGYFLPQHLGASMYVNKNFETSLANSNLTANEITEDLSIHIGGFGRSNYNHKSSYTWTENNLWMKGSPASEASSGEIKNNFSKIMQTFVPYEESNTEVPLGFITSDTKLAPWGGSSGEEWIDYTNSPTSFTGIKSVSAWVDSQMLKSDNLAIDCWTSDIYGNQYGLLKSLNNNCSNYDSRTVPGTLWTRLNNQTVQPAYQSLSSVFSKFKTKSFYSEITGAGIKLVDCFFDTLMIETSSTLLFCRLDFNYETSLLTTTYDNVIVADVLSDTFKFENTWLQTQPKVVTILFTELSGSKFIPTFYKLDLANRKFTLEFPRRSEDWDNLRDSLSGIEVRSLSPAVFSFNSAHQTYLTTYSGIDLNGKLFVIDFEIEQQENFKLSKTNRFFEQPTTLTNTLPIVNTSIYGYLNTTVGAAINFVITALNSTTHWELIGAYPMGLSMSNTGILTGSISSPGVYFINYKVTNNSGSVVYPITITVT